MDNFAWAFGYAPRFGALLLLILKQPNLSTAALMGLTLWMVALAAGLRWRSPPRAGGARGCVGV